MDNVGIINRNTKRLSLFIFYFIFVNFDRKSNKFLQTLMMKQQFSILLFLLALNVSAQNDNGSVIVYDAFDTTETLDKKAVYSENNGLKLNLGNLGRGIFMLNYERIISRDFSVEIGIGATTIDYLYLVSYDETEYIQEENGIAFEANVRYYPNGADYLDGTYFAPYFRYRSYKYGYEAENSAGEYETEFFDARAKELAFLVGYQTESGNFLMDYYLGLGYKFSSFPESSYSEDNVLLYSKENTNNFIVLLGVRIGLLF